MLRKETDLTVPAHRERPTPDQIAELPAFDALPLERITVVRDVQQAERALRAIEQAGVVGFDTEAKPTFTRDAVRDGPHVIQLATTNEAFIVQVDAATPVEFLRAVLESPTIVKVGFGLDSDEGPLRRKLGIGLHTTVDLSQSLRRLGYKQALGAKVAVAVVLGRRLLKSKSVTTSNWALAQLSAAQLVYAANDAYAALKVYEAMPEPDTVPGGVSERPARSTEPRHARPTPHRIDRPPVE
jgi:ribonuclease D